MSNYTFRNAKLEEQQAFRKWLMEKGGYEEEDAADIATTAHIGVLEGFQGTTPSYRGKVIIVLHQNVTMYEVFMYSDDGELIHVEQDSGVRS